MPAWLQHSLLVLFAAESSKQNNELELDKRVSCLAMKGKCLCCTSSGAFIDSVVQWQRAEHFFLSLRFEQLHNKRIVKTLLLFSRPTTRNYDFISSGLVIIHFAHSTPIHPPSHRGKKGGREAAVMTANSTMAKAIHADLIQSSFNDWAVRWMRRTM